MEGNTEFQKPPEGQLKTEGQTLEAPQADWLNGLKDRFSRMFKKEVGVESPELKFKFFYCPHGSAEDIAGLEDQLKKANIYIPENFGWNQEYLNALRKLSDGEVTPEMVLHKWGTRSSYHYFRDEKFFEIIYKSKKPITFIDIPENHSLVRREKENKIPNIEFGSNFGQAINSTREHIERAASLQKEREAYMLEQLQPQIQELLKTYPELRRRREVNILLDIGDAHTLLYHHLKEDYETTRKFSKDCVIFPYREEAMRRYMFNKPVDDELAARILSERLLSKSHWSLFRTNDSIKDAIAVRRLVSRFSFDEMKNMFEGARDFNEWADMFLQGLKERVKVPAAVK